MLSQVSLIYGLAIVLPLAYLFRHYLFASPPALNQVDEEPEKKPATSIMQAPRTDLAPPKDDPFTQEQLKEFNGSVENKPIYVAIKGTVFDVTHKSDVYGPGKSYGIFAGKDASKALGKSSLKEEDAVPDYSDLPENEMAVLNQWHDFFTKRYNIVGKVVDLPAAVDKVVDIPAAVDEVDDNPAANL